MDFKGFLHLRSYEAMVLNQIFVKMPRLGILAKGAYKFVIPSVTYLPAQNRLCVTKYGVNCFFDRVQLVDVTIAHSPCVLLWASAPSFPSIFLGVVSLSNHAPRDSRSDPPGLRSHEPSGSQLTVGGLRLSCGADLGGYPAAPSMLRSASPLSPHPMQMELPCLSERLVLRRRKPLRS